MIIEKLVNVHKYNKNYAHISLGGGHFNKLYFRPSLIQHWTSMLIIYLGKISEISWVLHNTIKYIYILLLIIIIII